MVKATEILGDVAKEVHVQRFDFGVADIDGDGLVDVYIDLKLGITVDPRAWLAKVVALIRSSRRLPG